MRNYLLTSAAMAGLMMGMGSAHADIAAAEKFLSEEIAGVSVLSADEQKKEMQWFIDAAKPFTDLEIKVVSETIGTHEYESQVLAPLSRLSQALKLPMTLLVKVTLLRSFSCEVISCEVLTDLCTCRQ